MTATPPYRERFLHVGFQWGGAPKINEILPVINTALSWYRYAPNCWILWTNNNPDIWRTAIQPYLGVNDSVVIAEIVFDNVPKTYQGWYDKGLWDWIAKYRDGGTYQPWNRLLSQ